jgi:hypothetical protein
MATAKATTTTEAGPPPSAKDDRLKTGQGQKATTTATAKAKATTEAGPPPSAKDDRFLKVIGMTGSKGDRETLGLRV